MHLRVEELTEAAFKEFGHVLGEPQVMPPNIVDEVSNVWVGFGDLMQIGAQPGKQITYLKIHTRPALYNTIEKHETSAEAFIPLEGHSVLMVVPALALLPNGQPDMGRARAFLLDGSKGILMHPGTWHAVPLNLTNQATFLVLVDDAIIPKNDIIKFQIDPVEFIFSTEATVTTRQEKQ